MFHGEVLGKFGGFVHKVMSGKQAPMFGLDPKVVLSVPVKNS
jgi:hypothetical protein